MKSDKRLSKIVFGLITFVLLLVPVIYTLEMSGYFWKTPVVEVQENTGTDKILHVVGDFNFAPYSFTNEKGEASGYDVEVIKEVARRMGYRAEVRLMEWDEAIASLHTGYADVLIGREISPVAANNPDPVSFPTMEDMMIIWGKDQMENIDQLRGRTVGIISGSSYKDSIQNITDCRIVERGTFNELFQACENGEVEYVLCRRNVGHVIARHMKSSLQECAEFMVSYIGFSSQKAKEPLLREIDGTLQEMREDGTMSMLRKKWIESYRGSYSLSNIIHMHRDIYLSFLFLWAIWLLCIYWMWKQNKYHRERVDELIAHEGEMRKKAKELEVAKVAAEAANNAKSSFLFNMSHDIRTPMNAILGFANLLREHGADSEKREHYISNILTSGQYLLELINNVLEMARIESGKLSLDEEPLDLNEFSSAMSLIFHDDCKKKGFNATLDVNVQHPYVFTDRMKCSEIVMNIISNAIKYTPSGGEVHVKVREFASQRPGWMNCNFVVEDNGIGMSKSFLPMIFESFARERTFTENKIAGTGLGMGIVKRLVDVMGGSIRIESELNKGTTVFVVLPMKIMEQEIETPDGQQNDAEEKLLAELKGKRILLAEDNELNAEIAAELLEDNGFYVEHAEDGVACLDMMENSPEDYYDYILMDVQMPNMDGYRATEMIRQFENEMKANIPIIAVTANVFAEDCQRAMEAGMDGFVGKPMELKNLLQEMKRFSGKLRKLKAEKKQKENAEEAE